MILENISISVYYNVDINSIVLYKLIDYKVVYFGFINNNNKNQIKRTH
jgi:hypothetical protein